MNGAAEAPAVVVDVRGRACPAPVIELARAAQALGAGVVEVLADDPAAGTDIPAWCRMRGARLLAVRAEPGWPDTGWQAFRVGVG